MKNSIILPVVLLSVLTTSAFADVITTTGKNLVVDPVTGVIEGTTNVITGAANTVGFFPFASKAPAYNTRSVSFTSDEVYTNLENGHQYLITNAPANSSKYVITNLNNGKKYRLIGVKEGTMDVIEGGRTVERMEIMTPVVSVRPI